MQSGYFGLLSQRTDVTHDLSTYSYGKLHVLNTKLSIKLCIVLFSVSRCDRDWIHFGTGFITTSPGRLDVSVGIDTSPKGIPGNVII